MERISLYDLDDHRKGRVRYLARVNYCTPTPFHEDPLDLKSMSLYLFRT